MDAQYAVSLGISDDFDKATGVVGCHGTARSGKREGADVNFNAFSFQLLFVLADPCNFRVGVDNRWDQVVVHLGFVALDALDNHDAFFGSLVRQHHAANHVTNGVDAWNGGSAVIVNVDETTLVDVHAAVGCQQVGGHWTATNGYDQLVEGDGLFAILVGVGHDHFFAVDLRAGHASAQLDVQTLFGQGFQGFLGHCGVSSQQERVQGFEHSDLGTQAGPDRTQFQADHASADHAQTLGNCLEFQGAGRINDDFLVNRCWWNVDRTRTWSQDHVFGFDDFDRTVRLGDFNFLAGQQLAVALQGSYAVGLEQGGNAGGQAFDDVGFTANHRGYVHGHASVADAVDGKTALRFVEFPGAVQQRLGRNATNVQASTAQCQFAFLVGVFFDASSREAQLCGLDGGNIAARACTNHYNVKFLRHENSSSI